MPTEPRDAEQDVWRISKAIAGLEDGNAVDLSLSAENIIIAALRERDREISGLQARLALAQDVATGLRDLKSNCQSKKLCLDIHHQSLSHFEWRFQQAMEALARCDEHEKGGPSHGR